MKTDDLSDEAALPGGVPLEEREELLALLLEEEGYAVPRTQTIRPHPRTGDLPLSFAQQRLWFLEQLEPGTPLYHILLAVRLTGEVRVDVLTLGFNEIIRRHEVLRTTFAGVQGLPIQIISPAQSLELPVLDLQKLPEAEQEVEAQRLARSEVQRVFDLSQGLLLRATLLRFAPEEHLLLVVMHHIISDDWSIGVLTRELGTLYAAFAAEKPSPLPELPIQYADFACWQREVLQGKTLESLLSYWQQQLAGAPSGLALLTDRLRPAVRTFQGAAQPFTLSKSLTEALKRLGQSKGATLFMTLLAAFKTLFYGYTGQEDLVVGTRIAGRDQPETADLIGFFVNALVLRTDFSGNPTFEELLERVRETALGAYAHQALPFEKLVEALQPARDLDHQPLFNVMVVLRTAPVPVLELPNLTLHPFEVETATAKYDLDLSMVECPDGLRGVLEYKTDLFEVDTIRRMLDHFQTLLASIAANPKQRLSDLSFLTEAERHSHNLLPASEQTKLTREDVFVAPQTPIQEMLAEIWAEVLELKQVGIHSNFFELGGHSLLATQIISHVLEAFQSELPQDTFELEGILLNNLFEKPTVAALAESIERALHVLKSMQPSSDFAWDDYETGEL